MLALTLHQPTVLIITGVVMPFIVGLVTRYTASGFLKGIVNLVLSGLAALIVKGTVDNGDFVLDQALLVDWFLVFAPSLLMYLGVYGQVDINRRLAPTTGIGGVAGSHPGGED